MTTPISFTVRPPSAPFRPSPLGQGQRSSHSHNGRAGPPSRRMFEDGPDEEDAGGPSRPRGDRNGHSHSGAARNGTKPDEPLVIPALPNRDWRQSSSRRTPTYRPEKREQGEVVTHERAGDEPQRAGLRYIVKREVADDGTEVKDEPDVDGNPSSSTAPGLNGGSMDEDVKPKLEELTLEQQALQALLAGDQSRETEDERRQRELIIASSTNTNLLQGRARQTISEDDAFKRDIGLLPEQSTADEYAAVPIEAFGAAMLRGMGWNPKNEANTKVHEPKQRPQLLGLGATPMDVTVKPTHASKKSGKERREEQRTRGGRGYNAAGLLVKRGKEDGGSGTETPGVGSSRRTSPGTASSDRDGESERERRRKREDEDDGRANGKRRENGDRVEHRARDRDGGRDREQERYRPREYETEEERARRKAREREKYGSSDGYDRPDRTRGEGRDDRDRRDRDRGGDRVGHRERDGEVDGRRDKDRESRR